MKKKISYQIEFFTKNAMQLFNMESKDAKLENEWIHKFYDLFQDKGFAEDMREVYLLICQEYPNTVRVIHQKIGNITKTDVKKLKDFYSMYAPVYFSAYDLDENNPLGKWDITKYSDGTFEIHPEIIDCRYDCADGRASKEYAENIKEFALKLQKHWP